MDELLDEELARRIPQVIHNSFGSPLPKTGVYFSLVLLACGLILLGSDVADSISYGGIVITGRFIFGTLLTVVSAFAATLGSGVYIDTANRKMKQYSSSFGIKRGEWRGMEAYPFLTLFKSNLVSSVQSRGGATLNLAETVFDVYLLSANHRERILVYSCESKEKADQMARVLGKKLEKQVVIYNPKSSSRRRR
ncbi:MAG TPA: hypothetical protein VI112_04915 [Bacteroidia bacterium]|jgi:hypothetical protein